MTATVTTTAPVTRGEFIRAAANLSEVRTVIPMANSRYFVSIETPEGWQASFPLSRLDRARFARIAPESGVKQDCMGRVAVARHGFVAEFSARGVILRANRATV